MKDDDPNRPALKMSPLSPSARAELARTFADIMAKRYPGTRWHEVERNASPTSAHEPHTA